MRDEATVLVLAAQAILFSIDEGVFHRRRGLPRWERIGHPIDTLTVLACLLFLWTVPYSPGALKVYAALAVVSCIVITKDEAVHARLCCAAEHQVHAGLFICHPLVLICAAWQWSTAGTSVLLAVQVAATIGIFLHQIFYWNILRSTAS